jgi:protein ImuB
VVRPRDPECEASATAALLEAAGELSPRVEDAGEGVAYLDADGLERHLRAATAAAGESGGGWQGALGRALMQAAEAVGLPVWVGVATSKLAARVAAGQPGSPTVVAAGEEAAFLAPLPLARLAPEARVAATLERWGIRTVGELARLPRAEVASRLGEAGEALHAVARGRDTRPLVPWSPPPAFREGMTLEWPLVNLEPFLFVGRAALERLMERLASRGLACTRLDLALRLEPDGVHERRLDLPAPTRDVKTLLTLLRLDLEAAPPGAPVAGFTLAAHPDRPREAQLSLFGPEALSPDRLATTLARLFALLGPNRAGSPRTVDGHRPERWALAPYEPPPPPEAPPNGDAGAPAPPRRPRGGHGLLAVRVLRPPVALEVLVDEAAAADPPPRSLAAVVREEEARRPRIEGRVRVASGPWGLEEEWWSEEPVARDYWDVELASGGLYRIYRDRASGEWYADGIYD